MMDKVSILIPAFKPAHFRHALLSALAQTWENKQILVSDDSPTEEIKGICDEFNGHLIYVRNPFPGEMGRNNLQHLFRMADGEFIKYLFDDDILHPFCVQHLAEALAGERCQNVTLAFSPRAIIDEKNQLLSIADDLPIDGPTILSGRQLIRQMALSLLNPIGELTTVLFKREDLIKSSGVPEFWAIEGDAWRGLVDVAVYLQLLNKGNAIKVEHRLSYFRKHAASNSNKSSNDDWFHVVADWSKVIRYANSIGCLTTQEKRKSYRKWLSFINVARSEMPHLDEQFTAETAGLKKYLANPVPRETIFHLLWRRTL
jgi:glycosyltransferase involved in cell wall biosynthesis